MNVVSLIVIGHPNCLHQPDFVCCVKVPCRVHGVPSPSDTCQVCHGLPASVVGNCFSPFFCLPFFLSVLLEVCQCVSLIKELVLFLFSVSLLSASIFIVPCLLLALILFCSSFF